MPKKSQGIFIRDVESSWFDTPITKPSSWPSLPVGKQGIPIVDGLVESTQYIKPILKLLAVAGTLTAIAMSMSSRASRQTSIYALSDDGTAKDSRHRLTPFGSGWHGLAEDNSSINYAALGTVGALGAAYGYFRSSIVPGKGPFNVGQLHKFVSDVEKYTPFGIGKTFGISELISSYTVPDKLHISYGQLVNEGGKYTKLGEHIDRLFAGAGVDIRSSQGLTFTKGTGPAMKLEGYDDIFLRFTKKGRLSDSSSRYNRNLWNTRNVSVTPGDTLWEKISNNFRAIRNSQRPRGYDEVIGAADDLFQPYVATVGSRGRLGNFAQKAQIVGLEQTERVQKMLSDIGMGLKEGTWNKAFHVPFVGEGGLVNQLLTKRFLPAALVAAVALPYLDYKTGHIASSVAIETYQRARLTHAWLTDHLLRSVTDKYEEIVPGPQYGPLALPASLAFAGGVGGYLNVLKTRYTSGPAAAEKVRAANSVFAKEGKAALFGLNTKSPAVIGMLAGLALMVPFIPGMIGSRKTKDELQAIYSGEEPVEVRAGRWWDMGTTPFEGGRIKELRPHKTVLWKTQAEKKALYGSEEEYWAHNPILHPLRWLKDPYYLEKKHYEDRPYPITSPAFTNVPLIGPILAATIGQLVKPVRRMHPEWDNTDYNLGSTRLEPRGPYVDSKLEGMVKDKLANKGYKVRTQEVVGDYRLDFAVENPDGKKIAIEADGASYHKDWNKEADETRQKFLEEQGWEVLRVKSTDFFNNPDEAISPIVNRIKALGVEPVEGDLRSGLYGLPAPVPTQEFSISDTIQRTIKAATEFVGLPGFIGRSVWNKMFPGWSTMGESVKYQGSRQVDSYARRYYELELGALSGISPDYELFGYSEPFRRFVQNEGRLLQANGVPNTMPSWLPGEDYFTNFKVGDPYVKVSTGYARLPGEGYTALHPELEGIDPERYPDIEKLRILGDVAPYSREFALFKGKVQKSIGDNTELLIEYQNIIKRADEMRKSVIHTEERRFSEDTEEATGTVKSFNNGILEMEEYPGRVFRMSGVSTRAADMSAILLGQNNEMTKSQVANEVNNKRLEMDSYLSKVLASGTKVKATFQKGALDRETNIRSVLEVGGVNVNKALVGEGYGLYDKESAGPEWQAMFSPTERALGKYVEQAAFTDEAPWWNPFRWIPTPYHTKLWQERSALSQYIDQETVGTRMRRWDKPVKDFLAPYYHGMLHRVSGDVFIPESTVEKRNLNTMVDMLEYLRDLNIASTSAGERGKYTTKASRTAIGANLTGSTMFLGSTLPDRDSRYFREFVNSTDDGERQKILNVVPEEMARALEAHWAAKEASIAQAEGKDAGVRFSGGRLVTEEGLKRFKKAETKLGYGDYERSLEIADFFSKTGLSLPESESSLWDPNIDYEDVKLKIIEMEGRDYHDFNIFDDRASLLWRKPYVDGAVQELTSGSEKTDDAIREQVEQLMLASKNRNANTVVSGHPSYDSKGSAKIDVDIDETDKLLSDMRRNPENYD